MKIKPLVQTIVIIVLVAGGILLWENRRMFNGEHDYYAYYSNIQGLQPSSPVQINGVKVGKIGDIDLNVGGRVRITLRLKKQYELQEGTVAYLASGGLTGEKIIHLKTGTSTKMLPHESVLPTAYDTSVMDVSVQITPMLETAKMVLKSGDSTLRVFNNLLSSGFVSSATYQLISIQENSNGAAKAAIKLNQNTTGLCKAIRSADTKAQDLANKNGEINQKIASMNNSTGKLVRSDMSGEIKSIQTSLASLKTTFGKVGKNNAITRKEIYTNSSIALDTLNQGIKTTYESPSGLTIFGGKKKK